MTLTDPVRHDPGLSPLEEIERRVQDRAADLALSLDDAAARTSLRALIDHTISEWRNDHRRGLRDIDLGDPEGVAERAYRNLAGYGPLEVLLADPDVWEVMVNAPDEIFVKRHSGASGYHPEVFHDDDHVMRTLTKVLDDSSATRRKLDPSLGLQDAQLDSGARLHIVHRELGRGNHVLVNIRKFTGVAFNSLDELVNENMLSQPVARLLSACMQVPQTVVFAGAPGAGKTTMLSCCAAELDPTLRVVTAEEVFEADIPVANVAGMQTRASRLDREEIDLRRLVAAFLRMAPDIAVVGEVRDREALPLLLTLSSGVKGYTTVHAGSARQALTRLRFICQLSDAANELPVSALNTLVSESVDLVVHLVRTPSGPRVNEIIAVEDLAGAADAHQFTATTLVGRQRPDAALSWSGEVPARLTHRLAEGGIDLRALLADIGRAELADSANSEGGPQ
jgi:pilus assembly protein CpaF